MAMTIIDCDQNSPEWYQARLGLPTASMFATIMAKGKDGGASKTRRDYLHKLAGEIVTGEPMEAFSNEHTERGKVMEDEARDLYSMQYNIEPVRVGFVLSGDKGCSPDSLLGDNGGLEIKTALPHIQIERLRKGTLPPEHRHQVQGNIWLCERKWWDFVSYCPRLPLFVLRVERDDGFIAEMSGAITKFNAELAETVEFVRQYGARKEAA